MSGRGQPGRGGRTHIPDFVLDTHRRGRGRPRRFPLSTPLQMPREDVEQELREEEVFADEAEEFYPEEERMDMEKINKIQQQKMMIVTPMGHKRLRGRPPRQTAPVIHSQQIDAEADEKAAEEYLFQGGPAREETISSLEEQEKTSAPPPQPPAKVVRLRQTPKRRNEFSSAQEKAKHLKLDSSANEESIEPLIPNEAHIEEEASASAPGEAETEAEPQPQPDRAKKSIEAVVRREAQAVRDPKYAVYERPEEENSRCPPPAPRHLLNRANSRGRPANMVPPHRRPLPKDIVPPGPSKRAPVGIPKRKDHVEPSADNDSAPSSSSLNLNLNANSNSNSNSNSHDTIKAEPPPEAVREVVIEENESDSVNANANNGGDDDDTLPPPIPPSVQQQIQQQHQQQHQHTPTPSAPPSNPIPIKREREAGKDLPSEHFPKERARPVSTRGLYPKSPLMQFEVANQMLMHHDEDGGGGAQQRVLTLQGGSFIEDRIGRVELMEDEEMKMMKSIQQQQYIQVEEDGVNVMYEVDPNDVIETEEQEVQEDAYVMERPMQLQTKMEMVDEEEEVVDDDDDDELPPQLVAEGIPEEIPEDRQQTMHNKEMMEEENPFDLNMMEDGEMIRLNSPNGRAHEVRLARDIHGNPVFIDENGQIVELVTDTGALVEPSNMMEQQQEEMVEQEHGDKKKMGQQQQGNGEGPSGQMQTLHSERPNLEFSFLDSNNICCGLCGEIVVYEKLVSEHLPNAHPEFLSPGVELEEIPYDNWLKTRLKQEMKSMQNGFRHYDDHEGAGFGGTVRLYSKGLRQLRKVSQIRVNVNEMTLAQLENALRRKLLEKMNRRLPVSLVDRLHARCDICQAVVSLNKKFEVVHLVRHFNAWHPAEHRCSQEWKEGQEVAPSQSTRRPLSLHDFAVVRTDMDQNNLQCIWCGMFMDRAALGMHFTEVHTSQVVVPNCSLCLQEMVMTARLMEKYGEDFGISLPDEFHLHSSKLDARFNSEKALDKAIDKHLKRAKTGNDNDEDDGHEDSEAICTTNSQQSFGRRNRLKRKFVKPCFRQICPTNSQFFEAKSACEWICRLCNRAVYGAVISAGAIKHYKEFHPAEIDNMQYELVKARLERIGDGSMEFVHPQLVECLICNLTYALHKPFNICRAIRHLRLKHPEVMPETAGKPISGAEIAETTNLQKQVLKSEIRFGELITDPIALERFRKDNYDQQFDKVQVVYGIKKNNEPAYILLMENEKMDLKTAQEMADKSIAQEEDVTAESSGRFVVEGVEEVEQQFEPAEPYQQDTKPMVMNFSEQIVEGEVAEELEGIPAGTEFIPQYDASNPDHVLIEENEIMNDANYEMIQEGEYADVDENRVRYMTEEEIQEAQARGEYLEFAEEYVEEVYQEQQ